MEKSTQYSKQLESSSSVKLNQLSDVNFFKPLEDLLLKDVYCYPENLIMEQNYKAVVLSGGGAKGLIEIGMLHSLQVSNCLNNVTHYFGTSIGAVVGLLMIIGYTPVETLSFLCTHEKSLEIKPSHILSLITKFGLCSFEHFFENIEQMVLDKVGFIPTISELYETYEKDFICVTYNVSKTRTEYLNRRDNPSLSVIEALKMSCNIPIIFEKYIYDNCFYIDGAITDNFAVAYADKFMNPLGCEEKKKILGLCIEGVPTPIEDASTVNVVTYLHALLTIPFDDNHKNSRIYKSENVHMVSVVIKDSVFAFNIPTAKKFDYFSLGFRIINDRFINGKPDILHESTIQTKPLEDKVIDDMNRETEKEEVIDQNSMRSSPDLCGQENSKNIDVD